MINSGRAGTSARGFWHWPLIIAAVFASLALGYFASVEWILLLVVGLGLLLLLRWPTLGLPLLLVAAVLIPFDLETGTAVSVNVATLLVPTLFIIWLLTRLLRGSWRPLPSPTTLPLVLFLLGLLLSFFVGLALWDPLVPRSPNFTLVQLAQWGLFVASAMAFWLVGGIVRSIKQLRQFTYFALLVLGTLAVLWSVPALRNRMVSLISEAINRAPFWPLTTALAAGQLLFNARLSRGWRAFCLLVLAAALSYTFVQEVLLRERAVLSGFLGVAVVLAVLGWFKFKRLRWWILLAAIILLLSGFLTTFAYDVVGGDDEWARSGGSRLALITRVLEVSIRNPLTGLGPAAYRPYANLQPLAYLHILWVDPSISSHNNYVDLFAHGGLLALGLFFWFMLEVFRLAQRLRRRFEDGFVEGYVNAMTATAAAMLAIMFLADWFLPFVYNVSFAGFQASVLVWMFLGGLVALDHLPLEQSEA